MVRWSTLLGIPWLLLAQATACPVLPALEDKYCVSTEAGWFYAESAELAKALANDAAAAAAEFERYFGERAARGAVVAVGAGGRLGPAQTAALRKLGATWILPWLSHEDQRLLQVRTLRNAIRKQLNANADDPRVEPLVQSALTQLRGERQAQTDAEANDKARSALRHEIGHSLLIAGFWGQSRTDRPTGGSAHYGGPAPDWLDETAAVLMENAEMSRDRRRQLRDWRDGKVSGPSVPSLDAFFNMEHPLKSIANEFTSSTEKAQQAGGTAIHMLTGERAKSLGAQAGWFYAQARGVADFLLETSNNQAVFGAIADALKSGQSMDQWLKSDGSKFQLPSSVASLEIQWRRWLTKF